MTAALALAALPLSGCYRHVVGAHGPGSDRYTVYEPNLKDEQRDRSEANRPTVPTKTVPTEKAREP